MRFLLPILLSLAAAPASAQDADPALTLTYFCADGAILRVAYLNAPEGASYAVVDFAGRLVPMHAGPVASGVRYVAFDGSGLIWHTKGTEGFLAHDDGATEVIVLDNCIEARG